MDQVPQTWDNIIQQQQTADGQSEMDMGITLQERQAMAQVPQTWDNNIQ